MSELNVQVNDDTARRVYGVLATSLNEVAASRCARRWTRTPGCCPKGRIGDVDALLAEFANRRVRIALYGEVKAGKSTLLNALAGAELSPVAFDPLTSIPVRMTYGSRTVWQVGEHRLESVAELTQLMRAGVRDASEVVIETDLDLLQLGGQVDLLDTPGVGSDARFDAISAEALRSLDAVVLVVRYPALYTQMTRRLIDSLQADIAKLFVVWNLDADCAELSAKERKPPGREAARRGGGRARALSGRRARGVPRRPRQGCARRARPAGSTSSRRRSAASRRRTSAQVTALREASQARRAVDRRGAAAARRAAPRRWRRSSSDTRERLQKVQSAADARSERGAGAVRRVPGRGDDGRSAARRGGHRAGRDAAQGGACGAPRLGAQRPDDGAAAGHRRGLRGVRRGLRGAQPRRRRRAARGGQALRHGDPDGTPPERTDVRPAAIAPLDRIERALGGSAPGTAPRASGSAGTCPVSPSSSASASAPTWRRRPAASSRRRRAPRPPCAACSTAAWPRSPAPRKRSWSASGSRPTSSPRKPSSTRSPSTSRPSPRSASGSTRSARKPAR